MFLWIEIVRMWLNLLTEFQIDRIDQWFGKKNMLISLDFLKNYLNLLKSEFKFLDLNLDETISSL